MVKQQKQICLLIALQLFCYLESIRKQILNISQLLKWIMKLLTRKQHHSNIQSCNASHYVQTRLANLRLKNIIIALHESQTRHSTFLYKQSWWKTSHWSFMNILKTFWAFKIFKYFQYFLFKVLSMYEYTFGAKSITVLTPKII